MNPEYLEINSHPLLLETTNVSNEQISDTQETDAQLTVSDNLTTKNLSPEQISAFNKINDLGTTYIKKEQQPAESLKTPIQPSGTIQSLLPLSEAFFKYLRLIVPWLWAVVIVVVFIPLIGQLFIAKAFQAPVTSSSPPPALVTPAKPTPQAVDWNLVKQSVHKELKVAHQSAEDYASKELDAWADDLINRVDSNFLDWYFSYLNQKKIEYKAFFSGIATNMGRWLNPNSQVSQERIAEIITEDFQTEFAKRVLRPQISQLRLERITTQTVQHYFNVLDANITLIPKYQQISQPDWNRYLHDLSIDIVSVEGKKSKLTGKALLAGEAYLAFKPLIIKMIPTIGSKVALKLAGKVGAKIAAKTGGILATKVGSVLLDSTVGVGILLWDVWDNHHTASIEKPILRDNLAQYLREVKGSLLNNPDNGIMTVVEKIQQSIEQSLDLAQDLTSENLS